MTTRSWGHNGENATHTILWEYDSVPDYDWWTFSIVRNEKGEFAIYSDSGCSCNWAYEGDPEDYDLAWDASLLAIVTSARKKVTEDTERDAGYKAEKRRELNNLLRRKTL